MYSHYAPVSGQNESKVTGHAQIRSSKDETFIGAQIKTPDQMIFNERFSIALIITADNEA